MRGFTLLELVAVVAILGVLLGVALPSYRDYLLRVNRTEAVSALLEVAGCQERVFAMTGRYDTTQCIPDNLDHYVIRMLPANESAATAFTAWADPSDVQEQDACGSFGVDQAGLRQVTGEGANALDCWRARRN